tara:strand:+ start:3496 stop:3657 length:162 start_codon:yes stop_codon:yes gene_type:complete
MMTELLIDRPLREVQHRSHFPDITIGLLHQGLQDTVLDLIGRAEGGSSLASVR